MTSSGAPKSPSPPQPQATLHIDDLLANGQGVGRLDSLVAFVTGALPGEDVRVHVDTRKANYVSGHVTEILRTAPERVASKCPVFPECGGCQVLHLEYAAQLEWKRRMLLDAFQRIGGLEGVQAEPTVPSPLIDETRYRNKVSLEASFQAGKPMIGFYAARSHRVVPIQHCPVLVPRLDDAVKQFIRFAHERPQLLRDVRHVVVRASTAHDSLVLCINTQQRQEQLGMLAEDLRRSIGGLTGIVTSWNPVNANAIFGQRFATLWGSDQILEALADADFEFSIASFFQINTPILDLIARLLVERLAQAKRVVDLYCGVGTFAVLLGKRGVSGAGIESFRLSVEEAAANAARNGVTNVMFECATAEEAVAGARGHSLLAATDAVILDPPRRGCEAEVLLALGRERVPRIEYLSCNPATLARDAKILVAAGYELGAVRPFDMFPHTGHVEALAEFELHPRKVA